MGKKNKTKTEGFMIKNDFLRVIDTTLLTAVTNGLRHIMGFESVRRGQTRFNLSDLAFRSDLLKTWMDNNVHENIEAQPFAGFFDTLATCKTELNSFFQSRMESGAILFEDITNLFSVGSEVVAGRGEEAWGGYVEKCEFRSTFFGDMYTVTMVVIGNTMSIVQEQKHTVSIRRFQGTMAIKDLPLRSLDGEDRAALTARGQLFREFCTGSVYAAYTGTLVHESNWSRVEYRANGRVMVDIKAFQKIAPDRYQDIIGYEDAPDSDAKDITITDDMLWRCSPYLYGFSFVVKQWGRMTAAKLGQINWRDDAFDKMVLDQEVKNIIKALVQNHTGSFSDIVEGKGGGVIFLLFGPPGEGKTLSAESVAELVHKPLYPISVGELGTNPDELEKRLRTILDVANMWDAVLLLDEADIFLEARNEQDIVRNAMVGVFLRLLEYQQGIIFLTSNRVRTIDPAFFSRISVALKFEKSTETKREQIWNALLDVTGIEGVDTKLLAKSYEINGRQIKNAIRLAQTLARDEKKPVDLNHIHRTITLNSRFQDEML